MKLSFRNACFVFVGCVFCAASLWIPFYSCYLFKVCRELNRDCVAIEQNAEYCGIARARFGKMLGLELVFVEEERLR